MQNLRGQGKLYDTGNNLIGEVAYDISLDPPGRSGMEKLLPAMALCRSEAI